MEIRLLDNQQIDKKAWDERLLNSPGFELYMQSSYLDIAYPTWKALVAGNYEAIFPVFEKKILFWKLLRQPLFTGPCIITGTEEGIQSISNYLPQVLEKYHWLDLNILNNLSGLSNEYKIQTRKFQQVKITEEGFIPDGRLKSNLKRAEKSQLEKLELLNADSFIQGVNEHLLPAHKVLSSSGLNQLHHLIKHKEKFGGECIGISNNENTFQAAQFFLKGKNSLYIILSFSSNEGRKNSALHALQKKLIDKHLKTKGLLHFGGSNIERVAEYNYNFGAEDVSYTRLVRKKFPFNFLSRK